MPPRGFRSKPKKVTVPKLKVGKAPRRFGYRPPSPPRPSARPPTRVTTGPKPLGTFPEGPSPFGGLGPAAYGYGTGFVTPPFGSTLDQFLAREPAPSLPIPGGFGGGGGGGGFQGPVGITPIKWTAWNKSPAEGRAPTWWRNFKPEGDLKNRPDALFLASLNSLIPYMSPEDQRRAAGVLFQATGAVEGESTPFSIYGPQSLQGKTSISKETSLLSQAYRRDPSQFSLIDPEYFQSQRRGEGAQDMLSSLMSTTGGQFGDMMPGKWMQQLIGALQGAGGTPGERMSRTEQLDLLGQLDPLLAQSRGSQLGQFGMLGQLMAQPFFSGGSAFPASGQQGQRRFGRPSKLLF